MYLDGNGNNFFLLGFPIFRLWEYLMMVDPEMRHAHSFFILN